MATHKLLLLPGDGIGPEVMAEVKKLIAWMNKRAWARSRPRRGWSAAAAYDAHGVAITDETMAKAQAADAVIFGAVGGPKWDKVPYDVRPGGGAAAPAQGSRPVRQHPPGDLLSGAGRKLRASSARWSTGSTSSSCAS